MRVFAVIASIIGGLLVVGAIMLGIAYVSAYNSANAHEKGLTAAQDTSESTLATHYQKIREAAQVPTMQKEDLVEIFTASNESRYGQGGSKGMMTWIQEQNPNLDQSTYRQLQQMIEAGRNDFLQSQKMMRDRKRSYETELGSFFTGFMMAAAGYPKIDLDSIKIVSTAGASRAFDTGIEEAPVSLRSTGG